MGRLPSASCQEVIFIAITGGFSMCDRPAIGQWRSSYHVDECWLPGTPASEFFQTGALTQKW